MELLKKENKELKELKIIHTKEIEELNEKVKEIITYINTKNHCQSHIVYKYIKL